MSRVFPYAKAAHALAAAEFGEVAKVAKEIGVSPRTIHLWRERLEHDEELQSEYNRIVEARNSEIAKHVPVEIMNIAERLPRNLDRLLTFLDTCFEELDPADPESARVGKECGQMYMEIFIISKKLSAM
jgi:hypothetical protein